MKDRVRDERDVRERQHRDRHMAHGVTTGNEGGAGDSTA